MLWTWRRTLQLAGLALLGIVQAAAALVVGYQGSRALTVEDGLVGPLLPMTVASAAALLIVSQVLQRRYAERFALGYVAELRTSFMSHVLRRPVDTPTMSNGLIMTRIVNDMSAIKLWLSGGLVSIVVAATVLLFVVTTLAFVVPAMAVTIAAAFLLWCIPVALCLKPLERHIRNSRRQRGKIASHAGSALAARLALLGFGRHGPTIRRLKRQSQKLNQALVARASLSGLLRASGDLIFPIVVLTTCTNIYWFSGTRIDAVSLGIVFMMTGLMATHLSAVALGLEYRLAHSVAVERIRKIFDRPAIDLEAGKRLKRSDGPRGLFVDGLPVGDLGTIVSLSAAPGEWVWLAGLSDAEADDLALKLARLKDTGSSALELDGRPADRVRARDWWREITVVSPRFVVNNASVRTNATLGSKTTDNHDEHERILRAFGLSDKILNADHDEGRRPAGIGAHAVRAARAALRHSAVVLVNDADLMGDEPVFEVFLREMKIADATVIVLGDLPGSQRQAFRRIDVARKSAA